MKFKLSLLQSLMTCLGCGTVLATGSVNNAFAAGVVTRFDSPTAISQNNVEFQIAQTSAGYCTVATQSGDPLNVRETPNGRIIGRVPHGSRVSLGVTDGSEGSNWTRIIYPKDGYVAIAYLTNCQYRY